MASIAKRPDGTWRARYRDEHGKEHSRHFSRQVDAKRWLDEVTTQVMTGAYVDPAKGRVTLAAFYAEWAERQDWASGTRRAMDLAMTDCTFTTVQLSRVRLSHAEQWVKSMSSRGLMPGTVRTRVNNVHSVVRAAMRDRHLALDPMQNLKLPRRRRAEVAMRLPEPEEVAAILSAADPMTRVMVLLAAFAGLRAGELYGLQVGDVDFLKRVIKIRRQLQRVNGGGVEESPPKFGSERDVYVPEELLAEVAAYVSAHRRGDRPARWVLVAPGGEPLHANTGGHRWRRACAVAGVTGLRLHDLRHFFASGLIAQGIDVVAVQRALGHQSAKVTLDTYSHLWPSAEDRTRAAAKALLDTVREVPVHAHADSLRTKGYK
ncbi:site-specific integrase [Streptomyces sp. NP160]|uniref:tyrosine-type recombinase/integrase n=1 Tax=Streptomyces sp. NP160 TaxID=2586637 RepID=UPI001119945D|nr:site-specific integrase [Streptomyces sp. NP160]TNM68120.1 site-specific integrase [Streptomyces sp. NP160]